MVISLSVSRARDWFHEFLIYYRGAECNIYGYCIISVAIYQIDRANILFLPSSQIKMRIGNSDDKSRVTDNRVSSNFPEIKVVHLGKAF